MALIARFFKPVFSFLACPLRDRSMFGVCVRVYRLRSKYELEAKKATLWSMTVSPTHR